VIQVNIALYNEVKDWTKFSRYKN